MTVNQLTYFTVQGHFYDVEAPDTSSSSNTPRFSVISAFVTFTPRLKPGTVVYTTNLDLGVTIAPPAITLTTTSTGGTLTAGNKYWIVTATNANGETVRSNEVTATLTGSTSSATLTWAQIDGATGYKVYRGTTATNENLLITTIGSGSTLTYTDTGTAGSSATPPTTNTAEFSANTAIAIAPVTARILEGELQAINIADSPNVQLLANSAVIGLTNLIYDVSYTNVVYAGTARTLANCAFTAPTSATTIDLSDPTLTRLTYDPTNYG